MEALLVPHEVATDQATVWIGIAGEGPLPAALSLRAGRGVLPIDGGFQTYEVAPGGPTLRWQRVTVRDLSPDTRYRLALCALDLPIARAEICTLPRRLPVQGDEPFTVLLGSCFCHGNPSSRLLEATVARLPVALRPNLKILSGDQVYLDAPAERFVRLWPMDEAEMRARFYEAYLRTWTHPGFSALLRAGANYFTADDHELWNNAPNAAAYATDTWTEAGRERWSRVARELYGIFQGAPPLRRFEVGELSFAIVDTRMHRAADRSSFTQPDVMDEVRAWASALRGPGVLVVGQPLLDARAGHRGHVTDWHLADYQQMQDLVRALAASRHSVVVLTGDVHFARVATAALPSEQEIVEVISSPMALVVRGSRPHAEAPPGRFPISEVPGVAMAPTRLDQCFEPAGDHFQTIDFTAAGDAVDMTVRYWPIGLAGAASAPRASPPRRLR